MLAHCWDASSQYLQVPALTLVLLILLEGQYCHIDRAAKSKVQVPFTPKRSFQNKVT